MKFVLTALVLFVVGTTADAQYYPAQSNCQNGKCQLMTPAEFKSCTYQPACNCSPVCDCKTMPDALDEVNAKRAQRGLRPFLRDPNLTAAAYGAAKFRAERRIFGHSPNDFHFVPQGSNADSAGCAAYHVSYGWLSCCTYENYRYAGASYVVGADGKRYMHLFVRR